MIKYLAIIALLSACTTQKQQLNNIASTDMQKDTTVSPIKERHGITQLKLGRGGGVTGKVHSVTIHPDGRAYQDTTFKGKLQDSVVDYFFHTAASFISYEYNKPNNIYNFIEIQTTQGNNRIVWHGAIDKNIHVDIQRLYKEINVLILGM